MKENSEIKTVPFSSLLLRLNSPQPRGLTSPVKIPLFLLRQAVGRPDEGSSQGAYLKTEHRETQTSTDGTGNQAYSHDARVAQGDVLHVHVFSWVALRRCQ
jgi:hypothetical protein